MTATHVDFLFDYASPWSYLAGATLSRWFAPGQVTYVPVYLRGFEWFAQGVPYSPAKMTYLLKDMVRSAAHVGVPVAPSLAEALEEPSIKETLRTNTDRGVGRGAFGVPSFVVGEELFWGHDRMHLAGAAAKA
jgi:2-hydroxychromene-2-carboxylate isomerase